MVTIQPLEAPEAPTKFDCLEYLKKIGWSQNYSMDRWMLLSVYVYDDLKECQSKELSKSIFEEFFNGDWRKGQEISKIVITKRFYQISPSSTQA